ncbi:M42 family metallopeptidase [Balneolales bacterium ANBcel1]|nr:M42 family metallopeptidase [Balneolales bacterium ANBcel1]
MAFDKKTESFLEQLLVTPSPAGFEKAGQQVWMDYLRPVADRIEADVYGSAAAHLDVDDNAITVMIEAHCDEIGMIIQHIDDSGFLYVNKVGGSDPAIARARKVYIHSRDGIVSGIIGHTAIHLQDRANNKAPKWSDLFVDIGAGNREEALSMVQVGDPVTLAEQFEFLSDDIIVGRALDNRIGGFVLAKVMENLRERKQELQVNVIALNAVQEEVGGFGARMMTYRYEPDVAIVTDVTHATDTPVISHKEHGLIKLGSGPVITHGGANHAKVLACIEKAADKAGIDLQREAAGSRTGTDTDSIFYQKKGVPSGLISLPLRYMHSPVETASKNDVLDLAELMTETVIGMTPNQRFGIFDG